MAKRLEGYTFKDLGPDGGPYDQFDRVKVVLHTTQGSSVAGAESAFAPYPPHLCYDPVRRIKRQYVNLDRHSYSLKNSEAEDDYVIQVEIVGFAESTHKWSDTILRNIAVDVILPLEKALRVPRRHPRFYRAGENGYVLASRNSPIRFSAANWRAYSGWLGHQHAPSPDDHWDPGGLPLDRIFSFVPTEEDDMTPEEFLNYRPGTDANNVLDKWKDKPGTIGHLLRNLKQVNDATENHTDTVENTLADIKAQQAEILRLLNASGGPIPGDPNPE